MRGVLGLSKDDEAISLTHMDKESYLYILSNQKGNVLYTGVTNDLAKRVYEHRKKLVNGFTAKYNVNRLVYFEAYDSIDNAIKREKQIKGGSRRRKIQLIESMNPEWDDLYDQILY